MKKISVFVLLLFLTLNLFAQDRGLTVLASENLGPQVNIGKQYALFIAIDAYRLWPALKKPVSDAKEIRDILKKDYYIDEVVELYNGQASKQNIIRTFTELQSKLGVHDSLFIYYAGHGHLDKNSDAGFWIPVDGGTDQFSQENWLPNSQIRGFISRFKTIHVFMVSDACFSGDILNTTRALPPQIDNSYYRKAYALTSRQVLTSGSSETVPDQSEFSTALINCLRKNTSALLDPLGIYSDVRLSVGKTTPLYGTLTAASHQEGATFLFFKRQSAAAAPAPVVEQQPQRTASTAVGTISVTSDIAGIVIIDGEESGTRIKAGGTVTVANVSTGATEVAVKTDDGKIVKAPQTVMVAQGQTVSAAIKAPAQTTQPTGTQQSTQTAQTTQPATAKQPTQTAQSTNTKSAPIPAKTASTGTTGAATSTVSAASAVSAFSDIEVISPTSGWVANKNDESITNVSIGKEQIDGRERNVLSVNVDIKLDYNNWGWGGALFQVTYDGWNNDSLNILNSLRNANGVRFKVLGDGKKWRFFIKTLDVRDYCNHEIIIQTQKGKVTSVDVPYSRLKQPSWGKQVAFNKYNIQWLTIERTKDLGTGPAYIKIFDFEIY